MFSFFNKDSKTKVIHCPECLQEQDVSLNALSAYCKNCKKRIDIKNITKSNQQKTPDIRWKPKTKKISCPTCHFLQEVLDNAISAYCKNCHLRISIKEGKSSEFKETTPTLEKREINCPHCDFSQNIPTTALSCFCSECGNRINLQNYQIRGRFRGELETKGNIYIASDGKVEGNINTGSLIIAGKFRGEAIAEQKIELKSTSKVYGKVIAPSLVISSGAVFVGHSHIGKKN